MVDMMDGFLDRDWDCLPIAWVDSEKTLDQIGHEKAKESVYPLLFKDIVHLDHIGSPHYGSIPYFKSDSLEEVDYKRKLEEERQLKKRYLDGGLAIDTVISAKTEFEGIITLSNYTVQERTVSKDHDNICIRLANDHGRPSEFFKFSATYFLLMVVNHNELKKWVWVPHAARLVDYVKSGALKYQVISNISTHSRFIVMKIAEVKAVIPDTIIWDGADDEKKWH